MAIELRNAQQVVRIDSPRLKSVAGELLKAIGRRESGLSILIIDDRRMAQLHEEWMGDDSPTDVLSFSQSGERGAPRGGPASRLLGDVVISAETAKRRSPKAPMREIFLYLVHGLLHLIGHDHVREADRRKMNKEAARLMGLVQKGRGNGVSKKN